MTPAPSNGGSHGNALVHYANGMGQESFERLQSRGNNESSNQKGLKRHTNGEKARSEISEDAMIDRMDNLSLGGVNMADGTLDGATMSFKPGEDQPFER